MGDLWNGAKRKSNCPARKLAGKGCCHHLRGAKANLFYGRRCTGDITLCLVPRGGQIMRKHKCSQAWNHKQVTDISNTHSTRIWNGRILNLLSSIYPGKERFPSSSQKGKKIPWHVSNMQDLLQLSKQKMSLGTSNILDFLFKRNL